MGWPMRVGDVIASRFSLESEVATGGMGRVYRGLDQQSGERVAIKLLLQPDPASLARFLQESSLLADLRHPGIVRYIAHGRLESESAYLIMEWLDGEDLAEYLDRRIMDPLGGKRHDLATSNIRDASLADSTDTAATIKDDLSLLIKSAESHAPENLLTIEDIVRFGRRLASAVSELHRRGIVHRDIKPANLFLPNCSLEHVKLIDLGTAHQRTANERLTEPGSLLGTPHYMAPEQARASDEITPATDIWAIGCVLYQCLTGVKPFVGGDLLAVLASIVVDKPVPLRMLRRDVPDDLASLVMSTLEKAPELRPQDADQLVCSIEALGSISDSRPPRRVTIGPQDEPPRLLTAAESRVTCMLFADTSRMERISDETVDQVTRPCGCQLQRLADGTLLIVIPGTHTPADQASRAARAACVLQGEFPDIIIALATGRTEGRSPLGPVMDAASRSLHHARPGEIRVDDLSASLLDARFHIGRDERGARLDRERTREATRTLLGKPSRWVGRRRELATLMATFDECVEEQIARAVLVTAPPGMGKSRLRHEFVEALRRRGDELELIYGQGDVVSAGSPFLIIAPAVRRVAAILDGEPVEAQRDKLRRRLAETVPAGELDRVARFLGELVGVPFPERESASLRAARKDPVFLGQLMKAAWEEWLRAECARRPVLMIIEDLDWGDLPSVTYIDSLLQTLSSQPFMVLALARPEVHSVFPNLWSERALYELPLLGLPPKASATLVRDALGPELGDDMVDNLVTRAGGNAFYLEELIRTVSEDQTGALPDTILGMVQVRLDALGPQVKRILRAGSIFGQNFWRGGVEALLGGSGAFEISEWLDELVSREVILLQPTARIPGEKEYKFRHALMRDGAYATLTEDDRRLGHALAGSWLESVGERDSAILAEHFMRGGDRTRALPHFSRAAEQALEGNDFDAMMARVERAVDAGATGPILGTLRALQAIASYWQSDYVRSQRHGIDAASLLPPGTARWFSAMSSGIVSSFRLGDRDRGDSLSAVATSTPSEPGADVEQLICLCRCTIQLALDGRFAQADAILEQITLLAARTQHIDSRTTGHINVIRGYRAAYESSWESALRYLERAADAFAKAGDIRNMLMERTSVAAYWAELGCFERAVTLCEQNLEHCRKSKSPMAITFARAHLGYFFTYCKGCESSARALLTEVIGEYRTTGNPRMEGWSLVRLATLELMDGNLAAAEQAASRAAVLMECSQGFQPWALAVHARTLLALDRASEAVIQARRATAVLRRLGGALHAESLPPHILAEALCVIGDHTSAGEAINDAIARIERGARKIADPTIRDRYLAIPEHQAAIALAARLS